MHNNLYYWSISEDGTVSSWKRDKKDFFFFTEANLTGLNRNLDDGKKKRGRKDDLPIGRLELYLVTEDGKTCI